MIAYIYIKISKEATKKLLELLNEFIKVVGYKTSIQIPVAFPYTNNKPSQREIKKIIPFRIASKIIKYLGINLTKEAKDVYTENYDIVEINWRRHK